MKKLLPKILLVLLFITALGAFFAFDLHSYLQLSYIKEKQHELHDYYLQNQLFTLGVFFCAYVLVTTFSLPAAAVLTLLSGALFGTIFGFLIVSFASTIGATLAFLITRFILRDYIQNRYHKQLKTINDGFANEGAFYLLALRLVPVFPFFLVNMLSALLPIKTSTFYLISQIGMLPGTLVYVYTGTQLAQIESTKDILSLPLIIAFTLLGLFPLAAKKLITWLRTKLNTS